MQCPSCGTESAGRFCPSCGTRLQPGGCADCGANLLPGARFCTRCGTPVDRAGSSRGGLLPWHIGAGVFILLLAILAAPLLIGRSREAGMTGSGAPITTGAPAPGSPPPLTGTPREQADRLFNRIMIARDRGDIAEAQRFTPMAVQAYAMAEPLDADGLFHLATIQIVAADAAGARATADRILADNAEHLLGLATAAEAAELAGDNETARAFHRRFLDAWDTENGRDLPEYQDHSRVLPTYRAAAERALAN